MAAHEADNLVELPLVSVVIVNYNYGRFLKQSVGSVLAQTYPNVECILVDNASTDESGEVIAALIAANSAIKVIQRASNDGQTPASLAGLAATQGHYVIFLDADDALLPRCIETHVFVHLSLRIHVGFTSGDMLQAVGNQVVLSTGEAMNGFIRWKRGRRNRFFRAFRHPTLPHWPAPEIATLADKTYYVPILTKKWVWSPTSGLCYRKDALLMLADNEGLATLRTGTDMYFAHGLGALCGSVLIDEPLFMYRFHGSNIYSRRPQLNRTLSYAPGGAGDSNDRARQLLIDHLVGRAERFTQNLGLKLTFLALLFRLDVRDTDQSRPAWMRRSRVAAGLVAQAGKMVGLFGRTTTMILMIFFGVPLGRAWRARNGGGTNITI